MEVSGYQSSDSEWEKISVGYSSSDELVPTATKQDWPHHEMVTSYYQHAPNSIPHMQCGHALTTATVTQDDSALPVHRSGEVREKPRCHSAGSRPESKRSKTKERKKHHQWDKVTLKRGCGAPYDPVEFLGITGGEKALLSHFSITTIGQLAYFNAMDFVSTHPEKSAIILDLQERAYQAVTDFVTKTSTQPDTVWGYIYLGDKSLRQVLTRGYLDSDSLYFLWAPMPAVMYRDQLAIDDLVGMETENRELRTRYSRFVKINLSKLCNKYYGRLYQRDPCNQASGDKWINLTIMEAAELAQREDLWHSFEPGNDIYSRVAHGSIVIPTGRIQQDCLELDKESCVFARTEESDSSDDEREESNPTVAKQLDLYY